MLRSVLAEVYDQTFWLPKGASTVAPSTDWLFNFVLWICIFFFLLIAVLTVYFCVKYRHREGVKQESTAGHSTALELTWTIIPTVIVLVIFYYGFRQFMNLSVDPPNSYEITATGMMWNWQFTYPNGYTSPELHVPAGVPVRVILDSKDVIHSLFVPAFRVKKDVVPGRYNRLWFQAEKVPVTDPKDIADPDKFDVYDLYCAAYCGTNHSTMKSIACVHTPESFKAWLTIASNPYLGHTLIEVGELFYKTRSCATCHSNEKDKIITGPSWRDMFGSQIPLADGTTVLADEAYVRESIYVPGAKIHRNFPNVMPSQLGMISDTDVNAIIAYMKSISVNFKGDLSQFQVKGTAPEKGAPTTMPLTPSISPPATSPATKALDKKSD